MKLRALILFLFCFSVMLGTTLFFARENPYVIVCNLVAQKIYLSESKITPWYQRCMSRSRLVKPWTSRALVLKDVRNMLQLLHLSHLEIYQPAEVAQIWTGVHKETGVDSEFVDSELAVFKVHAGSPAEKAGLRYGDVVVSLNGQQPNPWELNDEGGEVVYRRGASETKITLVPGEVQRDLRVQLSEIAPRTWVVKVPSFRREFFEKDWVTPEILKAQKIIVDLRGNRGGNFVAGFRLMAPFLCRPEDVGRLDKEDQPEDAPAAELPNDIDDKVQLRVLQRPAGVRLRTPAAGACLKARSVKVLVDAKTASVAEMVAQSLREKKGAEVLGSGTAGEMLVGVWYPLDEFGRGVEISIPEATYVSAKGRTLETLGVEVDQPLYYDLKEMQKGLDSWLERAKTRPSADFKNVLQ